MLYVSFGNRPLMTNTQTTTDQAYKLYRKLSELSDKESISNNKHPVDSVAWHEQNARHDAFHEATMIALRMSIETC